MKKALKTAPRGTAFNYAGQRWVVLEHNATGTLCLTEKIVEDRAFDDGNCNDFSKPALPERPLPRHPDRRRRLLQRLPDE
jgi:hypothetical protein